MKCINCKNWYLSGGSRGYSDQTPGYDSELVCVKGRFEFYGEEINMNLFNNILRKERICTDYNKYEKGGLK
jgi:hypothetical protein